MSMTVVPNPDGSYTITCGGAEVTVGGSKPAPAPAPPPEPDPPPEPWPEPDDNDGGVIAYLHVGPPALGEGPFVFSSPPKWQRIIEPPTFLTEAVPGAHVDLSVGRHQDTLVVVVRVPVGLAFDIDGLTAAARRLRGAARRVKLHVYVDRAAPAPLGHSIEIERS